MSEFILYKKLDSSVPCEITRWMIDTDKKGKYIIGADYEYQIEEQRFEGKKTFSAKNFLNYHAAVGELTKFANEDWLLWYSSKNILFTDLEKRFAIKNLIYSIVSLGIFCYFVYLRKRLNKFVK